MMLFGNGRYLMPLIIVAGPALVACADACWPRRSLVALFAITLFACTQTALLWEGARFRWTDSAWQDHWIEAKLPRQVRDHPVTFVTFSLQSTSWLSAFVDPGSRFVNSLGRPLLTEADQGFDRYSRLLAESSEIFAIFRFEWYDVKTGQPFPRSPIRNEGLAARGGLLVDFENCVTGEQIEVVDTGTGVFHIDGERVERKRVNGYFFCPAIYRPEKRLATSLNPAFELAFDKIEDACPRQFPPQGSTICIKGICLREYPSTDNRLIIADDGDVNAQFFAAFDDPFLGKAEELSRNPGKIFCHSNLGKYEPWSPGANMFSGPPPPTK